MAASSSWVGSCPASLSAVALTITITFIAHPYRDALTWALNGYDG